MPVTTKGGLIAMAVLAAATAAAREPDLVAQGTPALTCYFLAADNPSI
jgi:hypothetical protein